MILVFSANARAISLESNPALNIFTHPASVSKEIEVQDPLPESVNQNLRQMNIISIVENSVG